jgi:hypothetical protein
MSTLILKSIGFVECLGLSWSLRKFNQEEKAYLLTNLVFASRYLYDQLYINSCHDEKQKYKIFSAFMSEEYSWIFDYNETDLPYKLVNICSQRASICEVIMKLIYADLYYRDYRSCSDDMFPYLFKGYASAQELDWALFLHKLSLRNAFKILNILTLNKLGYVKNTRIKKIFETFDLDHALLKVAAEKINEINSSSRGIYIHLHEDKVYKLLKELFEKIKADN